MKVVASFCKSEQTRRHCPTRLNSSRIASNNLNSQMDGLELPKRLLSLSSACNKKLLRQEQASQRLSKEKRNELRSTTLAHQIKLTQTNECCYENTAKALKTDAFGIIVQCTSAFESLVPVLSSQGFEKANLLQLENNTRNFILAKREKNFQLRSLSKRAVDHITCNWEPC